MSNLNPLEIDTKSQTISPREVDVVNEETINIKQIFEKLEEDSFKSLSFFSQDMSNLSSILYKYIDKKANSPNSNQPFTYEKKEQIKNDIIGMLINIGNNSPISPLTDFSNLPNSNFSPNISNYSSDYDEKINDKSVNSLVTKIDDINIYKKKMNKILNGSKPIYKEVDLSEFGQTKPANDIGWVINIKSIIEFV